MNFQDMILNLHQYWVDYGCLILQPQDLEKGAGTFHWASFLRCLGPEPWKAAYISPSRRPTDGRYAENPFRMQYFYQYQVVLKPSPPDVQDIYLKSLESLGINLREHDIRFVEDDWESPTLGASGLGWEVWIDGMEITQFTYFQQMGSIELFPITAELTYGLERLAMYIQRKNNVFELKWNDKITYGEIYKEAESQWSIYNFDVADVKMLKKQFDMWELECKKALEKKLIFPAHELVLKCSHAFNMLDSRGVISVTKRTNYIKRVRDLARLVANAYLTHREELGLPLLKGENIG
ncbi:MAG: glycine--tRNA ligase subunit alpha [Actinobacteria bacterium]|nr:glycine--tRNA ligase subunit alpha [Actinomycetota bacterium]